MANIQMYISLSEWAKYKEGEEAVAFAKNKNNYDLMTIIIHERELLSSVYKKQKNKITNIHYVIKKETK